MEFRYRKNAFEIYWPLMRKGQPEATIRNGVFCLFSFHTSLRCIWRGPFWLVLQEIWRKIYNNFSSCQLWVLSWTRFITFITVIMTLTHFCSLLKRFNSKKNVKKPNSLFWFWILSADWRYSTADRHSLNLAQLCMYHAIFEPGRNPSRKYTQYTAHKSDLCDTFTLL